MKDKDGFYILKRREEPPKKEKKEKLKTPKKKVKKPKFKKGGWKWKLWDAVKHWYSSRLVHNFRRKDLTEYMIYCPDGDCEYVTSKKGGFIPAEIKRMMKSGSDAFIFVPSGAHMYTRLTLKSYKKLIKIEKVAIHVNITAYYDDGRNEPCTIAEYTDVIDNIASLLGKINYFRNCTLGLLDIQADSSGFVDYSFKYRVLVYKQDGSTDTYNSDLNDFLHDYGLYEM